MAGKCHTKSSSTSRCSGLHTIDNVRTRTHWRFSCWAKWKVFFFLIFSPTSLLPAQSNENDQSILYGFLFHFTALFCELEKSHWQSLRATERERDWEHFIGPLKSRSMLEQKRRKGEKGCRGLRHCQRHTESIHPCPAAHLLPSSVFTIWLSIDLLSSKEVLSLPPSRETTQRKKDGNWH